MNINKHKLTRWLIAIVAIGAVVVLLLSRTGVGESVKRESARLFDYEYIPNQNVDIDRCEIVVHEALESVDIPYRA